MAVEQGQGREVVYKGIPFFIRFLINHDPPPYVYIYGSLNNSFLTEIDKLPNRKALPNYDNMPVCG